MKVAIIGAGVTGLSLAYYLSKTDIQVDIYESDSAIGGLAGFFPYQGALIDKFYHHFYTVDTDLINLINEIGLGEKLFFEITPTGMYYAKTIYKLSSPLDLLKFKPLSLADRIRMGLLVWSSNLKKDYLKLEDISAKDWVISKAGKNVYDVMWEPLLRSKFGEYADNISAAWLWSKFAKRGGSRSKSGREKLGFLKGGLGIFINTLTDKLKKNGVSIATDSMVNKILVSNESASGIILSSGDKISGYDKVISTLSPELTAGLLNDSFNPYKNSLLNIKYLANMTMVLFLKRSLSDFYWLNINDVSCPFVGIIEHTKRANLEEKNDLNIVYISKYLPRNDSYFSMDKQTVLDHYLPWLYRIFPDLNDLDIIDSYLSRETYAQPVIEKGYRRLIPSTNSPLRNFHLLTMAQIYPDDRQISNSIKHARLFSEYLISKKLSRI